METSETKQNKAASVVIQTAVILFGLTVYAAGVVLFILPLDMIAAGTTGLGLMAQSMGSVVNTKSPARAVRRSRMNG